MVDDIICSKCNAKNPSDTVFCGKCGTKIEQTETAGITADPLIDSFVGDRFLVRERLGEGGMGVVYRAEQTAINRTVALKVLHASLTQDKSLHARFQNEAAASSRLNHPNTITVYDFGQTESQSLYIAMEYVDGKSLDDEIRNFGAMDWRRACRLAVQMCGSLADAHQNNIVHRDLKPENVMLCRRGEEEDFVKVLDFGIAKIMEDNGTDQVKALTKTGMVFGTPQYMSPEQIRGEKVDQRTDIYSMGVIIYQMLTGVLPFVAEQPMGVLSKHLIDAPPPFKKEHVDVPGEIEAVVMAALEKEADKRPQSMKELADRLNVAADFNSGASPAMAAAGAALGSGIPETVEFSSSPEIADRGLVSSGQKKQGLVIAVVVSALLLLGAGGAWYFLGGKKDNRSVKKSVRKAAVTLNDGTKTAPTEPPTDDSSPVSDATKTQGEPKPSDKAVAKQDKAGNSSPSNDEPDGKTDPQDVTDKPPTKRPKPSSGTKTQRSKDVACGFSSSPDPVAKAIRRMLSKNEQKIKNCARKGAGGTTAFTLQVPGEASRPASIKTTTSSDMDSCLRTVLDRDFGTKEKDARQGVARFELVSKRGVVKRCSIRVTLRSKGKSRSEKQRTIKINKVPSGG